MRIRQVVGAALAPLLVAVALGVAPAAAAVQIPAVCGTKVPAIDEEKQMLVEHVLYFHGTQRLGDVQGGGNLSVPGVTSPFLMDPTAPTGTETKYKTSKPGVFGNDTFGRNAVNGYWLRELASEAGIVCAGSTFYAASTSNTIAMILFFDKPYADTSIANISRVDATAPAGNGVRAYTGRFSIPTTKETATTDISIQFAPAAPGAVLAYDSTEAPSSFRYVTVEPKPQV
jgi:hypothetical protein